MVRLGSGSELFRRKSGNRYITHSLISIEASQSRSAFFTSALCWLS